MQAGRKRRLNGPKMRQVLPRQAGDLDFHQSPGVCLRSPGRRGRLRRAAEFTDESEFFSSPGGVGSGGPGKPGGEARGGLAVPAAVEISKDLARLGGGVGRAGGCLAAQQSRRRGEAAKGAGASLGRGRRGPDVWEGAEPLPGPTPRATVCCRTGGSNTPPPPPTPCPRALGDPGARLLQGETTMAVARDLLPGYLP